MDDDANSTDVPPLCRKFAAFAAFILGFGGSTAMLALAVLQAQSEPTLRDLDWDWRPALAGDGVPRIEPLDYANRIDVMFTDNQRFGVVCPRLRDPANPDQPKRLMRDPRGIGNRTAFDIDGQAFVFGDESAGLAWVEERGRLVKEVPIPGQDEKRSWLSSMEATASRVRITQSVEIVIGESTRLYDTAIVKYQIVNHDSETHTVGVTARLNIAIGQNNGPSFYVPPTQGTQARLVSGDECIERKDLPDFIQALEGSDLADPNTLAVLGVKVQPG